MFRLIAAVLLPLSLAGQSVDSIVQRKLEASKQRCSVQTSQDYLVAIPYKETYLSVQGSPFWETRELVRDRVYVNDQWRKAKLHYKGGIYDVKMLRYDCKNNCMVTVQYTPDGAKYIQLVNGCYTQIDLGGEPFIFHSASSEEEKNGTGSGYYHLILDGEADLLVKYIKSIGERSGIKRFEQKEESYIRYNGQVYKLKRLGVLTEIFPELKDSLVTYAEQNTINKLLPIGTEDANKLISHINTLLAQ